MKNKNLLIGGAVVVGGLLFFYLRKKRSENTETSENTGTGSIEKSMGIPPSGSGSGSGSGSTTGAGTTTTTGSGSGSGSGSGTTTTTTTGAGTSTSKLSNFEVNVRLLGRCGVMPPSFKKNQRNNWDNCKDNFKAELRGQGLISFNGLSEGGSRGLDFDGGIY